MSVDMDERSFDFDEHARRAVSAYQKKQTFYDELSGVVAKILEECLKKRSIKVHSVQHRSKSIDSFERKAAIPSETDPQRPKYADPIEEITDLAGVRVITHFPATLSELDKLICAEFSVIERSDKGQQLIDQDRFGYKSIHYLVHISDKRAGLAEYEKFSHSVVEIQVRTILQHTWAEIEHDIQYKSSIEIPTDIRRRFMALAGLLEIADREFQAIQDQDRQLTSQAGEQVDRGHFDGVEITAKSLNLFLDKKIGPDGRMSDWSYSWTAGIVKRLGFSDLKQLETAMSPYDDNELSGIVWGGRQGQLTRFETVLLAALGEDYIERHKWRHEEWFRNQENSRLKKLRESGISISTYKLATPDPEAEPATV